METIRFEPDAALAIIPMVIILLVYLVAIIITVVAFCKIFAKAGYSWALGLLMFIPIANLVMFLVLAFSEWPILKELRALKQSGGNTG
jgi:hypothetical protein